MEDIWWLPSGCRLPQEGPVADGRRRAFLRKHAKRISCYYSQIGVPFHQENRNDNSVSTVLPLKMGSSRLCYYLE